MKQIGDHTWQTTEPTAIDIGMPASPPSKEVLDELREAISNTGATTVYWFWMSVAGDDPHLGLLVAPDDAVCRVGEAVEPIWQKYSPEDRRFTILRFGYPEIDRLIVESTELLYGQTMKLRDPSGV